MKLKKTKRSVWLARARYAGYHNDTAGFTRLRVEARVAIWYLNAEWQIGANWKSNGMPCGCVSCKKGTV